MGLHSFSRVWGLARQYSSYCIFFVGGWRGGDVNGIDLRIIDQICSISKPFRYMMTTSIVLCFLAVPPHHSDNGTLLNLITCRTAFNFCDISAANDIPVYLFHKL